MRSPSLDFFYAKTNSIVQLTESYTEIEGLADIIKMCRLKPHNYVMEQKSSTLSLHRWWFDEYGNSLRIIRPKRVKITYNDLHLDRKRIVCTDLYYGLALNKVSKISKLLHVCFGKDEDLYQDCVLLSFLGLDNYLRSYLYLYGEWQQVSPLLMGIPQLKQLVKNLDIKYYVQLGNKENLPIPCHSGQAWISCLPASSDFLAVLAKQCEILPPLIGTSK